MSFGRPTATALLSCIAVLFGTGSCRDREGGGAHSDAGCPQAQSEPVVSASPEPHAPQLLYLPDGGDEVIGNVAVPGPDLAVPVPAIMQNLSRRCPPEMVDVKGAFCVDRWEVSLVDAVSGRSMSPYYSPEPRRARTAHDQWERERQSIGPARARATGVPELPDWQISDRVEPMAKSLPGHVPSGYLDGSSAERACERAGKRLCTAEEWTVACRGETNRTFPYGDRYEHGACNVFRESHPAVLLHGDASVGHMDPRLNQVDGPTGPLLRRTGASPRCASPWGRDAIFDMVGNLDEWISDGDGAYMGGFYARATRLGCDARISVHPKPYADYSLGTRCCK